MALRGCGVQQHRVTKFRKRQVQKCAGFRQRWRRVPVVRWRPRAAEPNGAHAEAARKRSQARLHACGCPGRLVVQAATRPGTALRWNPLSASGVGRGTFDPNNLC